MIIKKKYTTITKPADENQLNEETELLDENQEEQAAEVVEEQKEEPEQAEETVKEEEPKPKRKKKTIEDLDLSLENIQFEQREERREGTRRRGYRRTQDRTIVSRAQKDAETIREGAKKEGYQAGIDMANQDIEELKGKFAEFFKYKDEIFAKVSGCILDVSVEIAKKIIKKETETDNTYLIPMIQGVVEEINKTENKITIKVMPKDVEIVKDKISDIFSGNSFDAAINVIPDKKIKEGGVIVETSNGIIDASIETQLAIIEKAFSKQEES
jgi:flagellar biosynthesis/type III secretory pathway protein FliH